MPLGQFRAIRTVDQRNVGINGVGPVALDLLHRAIDRQLTESVVQVIVAADDVGDTHVMVIDDGCEHVGRRTVGPQDDVIVDLRIGDSDGTLYDILDGRLTGFRCFQADDERCTQRSIGSVAVPPASVIAKRLPGSALRGAHFLELFRRGEAFVGETMFQKLFGDLDMAGAAL